MRILLDEYGMSWEKAWDITTGCISYTNHTVMAEALEKWPQDLFQSLLPRIYQIVHEINQRFVGELWQFYPSNWDAVTRNAVLADGQIRMANLCLVTSHTINGVSALHSDILKHDVFRDYYAMHPEKFTNVTNGITHRRWVAEANPELAALINELIGEGWLTDADELKGLMRYMGDSAVLGRLAEIKRANKVRLAAYIKEANGIVVDPDSVFDVQVKRLHEYKRQLLNALHILDLYFRLKENPNLDIKPRTFIFGAKAASAYYMAKQIIRFICTLAKVINNDPDVNGKLKVVFLENYRVTLAELIMPAAEVSEQISIAGKEASGTGNMKFMINGALTVGTLDGANVEIHEEVGDENIFLFGLHADEVQELWRKGYNPTHYYQTDPRIKRALDALRHGIGGVNFSEIADSLTIGRGGTPDGYMVLADFASYCDIQRKVDEVYRDAERWNRMSLINIAKAGFFAADRAVKDAPRQRRAFCVRLCRTGRLFAAHGRIYVLRSVDRQDALRCIRRGRAHLVPLHSARGREGGQGDGHRAPRRGGIPHRALPRPLRRGRHRVRRRAPSPRRGAVVLPLRELSRRARDLLRQRCGRLRRLGGVVAGMAAYRSKTRL